MQNYLYANDVGALRKGWSNSCIDFIDFNPTQFHTDASPFHLPICIGRYTFGVRSAQSRWTLANRQYLLISATYVYVYWGGDE